MALLVIALALPAREGETLKQKARTLLRHLPGAGWLHSRARREDSHGD